MTRAKPLAAWVGGKSRLFKTIEKRIEQIPHRLYAEPFLGMGGVFIRRQRSRCEVVNDLNGEIVNLFRIVQRHPEALIQQIRYLLNARAEFDHQLNRAPDGLTDIERAARFLYLQRVCYGGKTVEQTYTASTTRPVRFERKKVSQAIDALHERLEGVGIECLPYAEFITRYDSPETLFYLDPPYYGCEDYYGREFFSRADFQTLAGLLVKIKRRFLLSLNDHPAVRQIFAEFEFVEVAVNYSINSGNQSARPELIISDAKSATSAK